MHVDTTGRYLGFQIGPGKGGKSWTSPLVKFEKRTLAWADMKLGVHMNMRAFKYENKIITQNCDVDKKSAQ